MRAAAVLAGVLLIGPLSPPGAHSPAAGQAPADPGTGNPPARGAFALDPDTVGVGEPFTLGLTVRTRPGWRPRFPALLPLEEGFEQRTAVEVVRGGPETWRAYYRLVAWETTPGGLPPIDVEVETDAGLRAATFRPPSVSVRSVLPDDGDDLELRPARPFLERAGPPWLAILLGVLALAAALAWAYARRRRSSGEPGAVTVEGPAERALRELGELRARWEVGELAGAAFYDGLEGALRRYAAATRGWPPGTLMGELPNGNRELAGVLRRSALARFARVDPRKEGAPAAIGVCEAWLRRERAVDARASAPAGADAASVPAAERASG